MRAAIYCRISQDKTGEAAGVTRQQEDCQALADQHGWPVVEVFVDNDISATSGKPRPAYRRMLRAIEDGEVQAILAWHPDRIYRRLADLEELITVVEARGVAIRTARAGDFDLGTPTGRMIARILASVATGEVEVKADRWQRSFRQRREAGAWSGGGVHRTFGYTRDGAVVPDEAFLVRWLADQVIAGRTLTALCRELNEQGVLTTAGNRWATASLRFLLTNPRVAGLSAIKGEVVGPGSWEPLLDLETWETVRAVLFARQGGPRRARVALLLDLVYCGRCGARMVTGGRGGVGKARLRTYRCQPVPGRSDAACGRVSVAAEQVEQLVEGFARTRFADPQVREAVSRLQAVDGPAGAAAEAAQLELRIRELEEQLDRPGVPVAAILRARDRAQARLNDYRSQLADAAAREALPPASDRGGEWPADLERRRRLVGVFVARVVVQPAEGPRGGPFDPRRIRIEPRWV